MRRKPMRRKLIRHIRRILKTLSAWLEGFTVKLLLLCLAVFLISLTPLWVIDPWWIRAVLVFAALTLVGGLEILRDHKALDKNDPAMLATVIGGLVTIYLPLASLVKVIYGKVF